MALKYIVYSLGHGIEKAIVFHEHLVHSCVMKGLRAHNFSDYSTGDMITKVSAGFCARSREHGVGGWVVWGESESMKLKSRPQDDKIIAETYPCASVQILLLVRRSVLPMNVGSGSTITTPFKVRVVSSGRT